jgi:electron transfer flavoprotein beta subunit
VRVNNPPEHVAVAMKWSPLTVEVDSLTGSATTDPARYGASPADLAALEWGLRAAEAWGASLTAICVGPAAALTLLREALAAGANRAVLVDDSASEGRASSAIAEALDDALPVGALVFCGDRSLDRGSGAVPAFLAARRRSAQALGIASLELEPGGSVLAERRLDGGRRERLRLQAPAVLSLETGGVRLRRTSMPAVLAARDAVVERRTFARPVDVPPLTHVLPYRPRPKVLAGPAAQESALGRILALTGALAPREQPRRVVADPQEAAEAVLEQLRIWGYL